ncbi:hypothetical protein LJ737_19590 [Hymenobacter sp. 15J16-1T3B]|uniref:hypothetical protein n=1 Tax=Hymenobacter sp. 15J16-1T3B TaxID=2886941 RepID=UPI001D1259FA|nr:hypothetical protein [Hymenobacter sp. 15J16-1T3B]MCC3159454.1 hypothetical protein [Hymenobacter sp. 15J16-1T3B]
MSEVLDILADRKLSAVVFVQDYLQLQFDGDTMTLYAWPTFLLPQGICSFGDVAYRNELCSFITRIVQRVELLEQQCLTLYFKGTNDVIRIPLDTGREAVYFTEYDNTSWLTL